MTFSFLSTHIEVMSDMRSVSGKRTRPKRDDISEKYPPLTNGEVEDTERNLAAARERALRLPELTPEEDAALTAAAESDPDNPPLRDDAVLRPMYVAQPAFLATWLRRKRGRPAVDAPKKQVTLRLDQDVIEHFRSTGPGWQTRINDALRTLTAKKQAGKR